MNKCLVVLCSLVLFAGSAQAQSKAQPFLGGVTEVCKNTTTSAVGYVYQQSATQWTETWIYNNTEHRLIYTGTRGQRKYKRLGTGGNVTPCGGSASVDGSSWSKYKGSVKNITNDKYGTGSGDWTVGICACQETSSPGGSVPQLRDVGATARTCANQGSSGFMCGGSNITSVSAFGVYSTMKMTAGASGGSELPANACAGEEIWAPATGSTAPSTLYFNLCPRTVVGATYQQPKQGLCACSYYNSFPTKKPEVR